MALKAKTHTFSVSPGASPTAASTAGVELTPPDGFAVFVKVLQAPTPTAGGNANEMTVTVLWSDT